MRPIPATLVLHGQSRPSLVTLGRSVQLRPATWSDAQELLAIRNHYILNSDATFDETPIAPETMTVWMSEFSSEGPYRLFVAVDDGRLLGYAGSHSYRSHRAFARTVETTVYIRSGATGQGVGSALYRSLFAALAHQGLHRAVAGIALPNASSVKLHARFGFVEVGTFDEYAHKHERYVSSLWMQRPL